MDSKGVKKIVKEVVKELKLPRVKFVVEYPADEGFGDYSTNVALVLANKTKENPKELAKAMAKLLEKKAKDWVEKVEASGPGFINISIKTEYIVKQIEGVLKGKDSFGKNDRLKSKKIMIEFTDPNPFKEFHIGHLYSNIVGESLCRLLETSGAEVKRVNYQGDVGMHVAKALYGLRRQMASNKWQITDLEKKPLKERVMFLGQAYALGATAYEKDKKAKKEIEELNTKVFALDADIKELYEVGRKWSLEYFETIYRRLGTKFDFYYFEREVGEVGLKLVKEFLKKGVFEESKGAVVFSGEKSGLHTRVFINSLGLPTYEAKELGLAPTKYKDFAYDQSIILTGNEIDEYFKVLIAALKQVSPELGEKTMHLSHGMVRLPEGKMSSRTGEILTGEWLLDEAKKKVLKIIQQGRTLSDKVRPSQKEIDETAEMVGKGAVKWALLKSGIGRDIAFDIEESVSLEGNSGPYLQYTHARARSVLARANGKWKMENGKNNYQFNSEELSILRWLYRFPEVVEKAGKEYAPHEVCTYLFELAQRFNSFYNKHSILGNKKQEVASEQKQFRLGLTAATAQVIKNGLYLLGIAAPERM